MRTISERKLKRVRKLVQGSFTGMSPEAARTFNRHSAQNAGIILARLAHRKCSCDPYKDVFTMKRWNAQSRFVRKGEPPIEIPIFAPIGYVDPMIEEEYERRNPGKIGMSTLRPVGHAQVWCRCQVIQGAVGTFTGNDYFGVKAAREAELPQSDDEEAPF